MLTKSRDWKNEKKVAHTHSGRWMQKHPKREYKQMNRWEKLYASRLCAYFNRILWHQLNERANERMNERKNERIIAEINANRIKWMWQHIIMIYSMCKKGSYEHASGANLRIICRFLFCSSITFGEIVFSFSESKRKRAFEQRGWARGRDKVSGSENICLVRSLSSMMFFLSSCTFRLDTNSNWMLSIKFRYSCSVDYSFCLCGMQIENKRAQSVHTFTKITTTMTTKRKKELNHERKKLRAAQLRLNLSAWDFFFPKPTTERNKSSSDSTIRLESRSRRKINLFSCYFFFTALHFFSSHSILRLFLSFLLFLCMIIFNHLPWFSLFCVRLSFVWCIHRRVENSNLSAPKKTCLLVCTLIFVLFFTFGKQI